MPSGSSVHRTLVHRIRDLRSTIESTAGQIETREAEVAQLRDRQARQYRALAEFHLPQLDADAVAGTLEEMGDRIRTIFDEKQKRWAELRTSIPVIKEEIGGLEQSLRAYTDELNRIGEQRNRLSDAVTEELNATPGWEDLIATVRRHRARLEAAERRYQVALQERTEKVPAYEADTFFGYLLARRYGAADAAGNALTKRLDAWLAGLTGYEDARADYEVLNELPDHAASVRAAARSALDEVSGPFLELRANAADRHGLTLVLEEGDAVYAKRGEVIASLKEAEGRHLAMEAELSDMDDSQGRYFERAAGELQEFLETRTPRELLQAARSTDDARDDAMAGELADVAAALQAAVGILAELRARRTKALEHVKDLTELRREFEARDWDGGRSTFSHSFDMDAMLMGYLAGRHSASHIRREVRQHQAFEPHRDSRGSGGGFRGFGGFSTGGGFGGGGSGGGFSTGGGF